MCSYIPFSHFELNVSGGVAWFGSNNIVRSRCTSTLTSREAVLRYGKSLHVLVENSVY